jgi:short-subunit dehydrogenase
MADFMNDWALVTGASSGIGYELAKLLAADRFSLALVARDEVRLNRVADELRAASGVVVRTLAKDLASPSAPREILDALLDARVSVLVNNAGFGWRAGFADADLQRWLDMMRVNMDAVVQLTRMFVTPMLSRRQGRILNVASTAAFQPGPSSAMYFATKAFVFSFSCAIAEELAGTGITVTTLFPGPTRTQFHARAGIQASMGRLHVMEAETVARIGYRALMKGKHIVIPGMVNKITSLLANWAPTRLTAKAVKRLNAR